LIPCFHAGADYLINLPRGEVAGRFRGLIGGGSSTPSLCTFLTTVRFKLAPAVSSGFAQGYRAGADAGLGSSEFTQFFNHSHLWKLQLVLQPDALPLSYCGL